MSPGRYVRRIDLLAKFVSDAVHLTMKWTGIVLAVGSISVLLGWPGVTVGAVILLFAAPLLFVPWIVLEADVSRFPEMAEEARWS